MTQENKITRATKEQDVKYKTQGATSLEKAIAELSSDKDTTNTELAAVLELRGEHYGYMITRICFLDWLSGRQCVQVMLLTLVGPRHGRGSSISFRYGQRMQYGHRCCQHVIWQGS